MGTSGRPPFNVETGKDAIEYHLGVINAFIAATNFDNEPFVLAGHSFGGYLAAHYALNYPNSNIQKLLLFSPVGIP